MEVVQQIRAVDSKRVFGPSTLIKAVSVVWIPGALFVGWQDLDRVSLWLVPIFWALIVAWRWPRRIRFTESGMEQRDLLGRMKVVRYEEVIGAKIEGAFFTSMHGLLSEKVVVYGTKSEIVHSPFHADRYGFIELVRERTHKRVEYEE
jgi:hypothetical protein